MPRYRDWLAAFFRNWRTKDVPTQARLQLCSILDYMHACRFPYLEHFEKAATTSLGYCYRAFTWSDKGILEVDL